MDVCNASLQDSGRVLARGAIVLCFVNMVENVSRNAKLEGWLNINFC